MRARSVADTGPTASPRALLLLRLRPGRGVLADRAADTGARAFRACVAVSFLRVTILGPQEQRGGGEPDRGRGAMPCANLPIGDDTYGACQLHTAAVRPRILSRHSGAASAGFARGIHSWGGVSRGGGNAWQPSLRRRLGQIRAAIRTRVPVWRWSVRTYHAVELARTRYLRSSARQRSDPSGARVGPLVA